MSDNIRLDKFISERTELSRSVIKQLASKGGILVDGAAVKKTDTKIDPKKNTVTVSGRVLSARRDHYILMNKPEGYVCSTGDRDGRTVMELIPDDLRTKGMFPAGRLDKDSTGALIITDDGDLAHRLLAPGHHVPKIYIVKLARPFQNKYIDKFAAGVVLSSGEEFLPARIIPAKNCEKLAFVEICEGKYHQIKRMFAAVENHVENLHRISVGGLILPEKLGIGECMELLHKDVENLFSPLDFEKFCRDFEDDFSAKHINK